MSVSLPFSLPPSLPPSQATMSLQRPSPPPLSLSSQPPKSFHRTPPSTVTHHPHPQPLSPNSTPLPFRPQLHLSTTNPTLARPVPTRCRPTCFSLPQRPEKPIDSLVCDIPILTGHARSRSHGEMKPGRGARMLSFGSAVTPASPGSTTDGEEIEVEPEEQGRQSWEWPWDNEHPRNQRVRSAPRPIHRQESIGSEPDPVACPMSTSPIDRKDWRLGTGRYSTRVAPHPSRSQSALAHPDIAQRRADGPRPWDMTELSQTGKNFASFGFRKNLPEPTGGAFGDAFASRHLPRNPKGKGRDFREEEGGRKRFRFFRKKLSVTNVLFRS